MKNIFLIILSIITIACAGYTFLNQTEHIPMITMFLSGFALAIFLMTLKINVKNKKLNSYKRELEKEAIASTESSSRVKVLESKIEVLEKALENALKKWYKTMID